MQYTEIFRKYKTKEGQLFYLLNKRIDFPTDKSLEIYDSLEAPSDIPWTILSYQLYDTIDYWWVLTSINKSSIFYAKTGDTIYYIKPDYIDEIINLIKDHA